MSPFLVLGVSGGCFKFYCILLLKANSADTDQTLKLVCNVCIVHKPGLQPLEVNIVISTVL